MALRLRAVVAFLAAACAAGTEELETCSGPQGCNCTSQGRSHTPGCRCAGGYVPGTPWICERVPCPYFSYGDFVDSGCICYPGYSGVVNPSHWAPYYIGSCSPVDCPTHSTGQDVPTGCVCEAGFEGSINASSETDSNYLGYCSELCTGVDAAVWHFAQLVLYVVGLTTLRWHGVFTKLEKYFSGEDLAAKVDQQRFQKYRWIWEPTVDGQEGGTAELGRKKWMTVDMTIATTIMCSLTLLPGRKGVTLMATCISVMKFTVFISATWLLMWARSLGYRRVRVVDGMHAFWFVSIGQWTAYKLSVAGACRQVQLANIWLWTAMLVLLLNDVMPVGLTNPKSNKYSPISILMGFVVCLQGVRLINNVMVDPLDSIDIYGMCLCMLSSFLCIAEHRRLMMYPKNMLGEGLSTEGVLLMLSVTSVIMYCAFLAIIIAILNGKIHDTYVKFIEFGISFLLTFIALTLMNRSRHTEKRTSNAHHQLLEDLPGFERHHSAESGGSSFVSGDLTVNEKISSFRRDISKRKFLRAGAVMTNWRSKMMLTLFSCGNAVVALTLCLLLKDLPVDRSVLGMSAHDAAVVGWTVGVMLCLLTICSLLFDQGMTHLPVDNKFRMVSTLKPLMSVMKIVVLYCPDSTRCTPAVPGGAMGLLRRECDILMGTPVLFNATGTCSLCCATKNLDHGSNGWIHTYLEVATVISLLVTMLLTFTSLFKLEVKGHLGLKYNHLSKFGYMLLWVSTKAGLLTLTYGSLKPASAVLVVNPKTCEGVSDISGVPDVSSMLEFLAIAGALGFSCIAVNEAARMFDSQKMSDSKKFQAASSPDGARVACDTIAMPVIILFVIVAWPKPGATRGNFLTAGIFFLGLTSVAFVALVFGLGSEKIKKQSSLPAGSSAESMEAFIKAPDPTGCNGPPKALTLDAFLES